MKKITDIAVNILAVAIIAFALFISYSTSIFVEDKPVTINTMVEQQTKNSSVL